nr:PREDICTED: protein TANC2 [Bemisia tabaci]
MLPYASDLAAIRKLLEVESGCGSAGGVCPTCKMPFDKGKKRKLIDTCGHERCYSCMFRNERCPLCVAQETTPMPVAKKMTGFTPPPTPMRNSQLDLHADSAEQCPPPQYSCRPKPKLASVMRSYDGENWPSAPSRLPRPTRSILENGPMTQSCPTPPQSRRRFFLSPKTMRSPFALRGNKVQSVDSNGLSDEEAGSLKGSEKEQDPKKSSQNDLYMRLGLLLGEGGPTPLRPFRSGPQASSRGGDSVCSLTSLEANTLASDNTSPISTLTGSSEVEVHSHSHEEKKQPLTDSVGSLMSMSSHSCSSSPLARRHSITNLQRHDYHEDQNVNRYSRRAKQLRSMRSHKGLADPKACFAHHKSQQLASLKPLTLKPLFFQVPLEDPNPLFLGRDWLVNEIEETLSSSSPAVIIHGLSGGGKTALILQLVKSSCFGQSKESSNIDPCTCNIKDRPASPSSLQSINCQVNLVPEKIKQLAQHVVAYHFCQVDNNITCLVPEFIHSVAAQMCQAPQLTAYKEYLQNETHLQNVLSMKECIADPDEALIRGVIEPLCILRRIGKIPAGQTCVILVDALCEAEYHQPDVGDTIGSFLAKHLVQFPSWLKVVATVKSDIMESIPSFSAQKISLDEGSTNTEHIHKDLLGFINHQVLNSTLIQNNLVQGAAGQLRFCQHLLKLTKGSFMFAKLILDLFEKGQLVAKSASYKVLPVTLSEIYLLHCNLRFPSTQSFEKVCGILSVCLAALYPLTLIEIYYSVNALNRSNFVPWDDFLQRFKLLSGFLVKRIDNTYMFFHPSFREWLIKGLDGETHKFICDLRAGHAGIAFRLSRLQTPLDAERTLELGHHILKAHIYKNMTLHKNSPRDLQSHWVALSSKDVSEALCYIRNIYSPNVKVSRLLLLSGASPDHITNLLGSAPALCLFAQEGMTEMVGMLLEFGASINLANNQGSTGLCLAASNGHTAVVRQLVAAGAALGRTDTSGRCALVHAARNGHLEVIAYLLACDWVLTTDRKLNVSSTCSNEVELEKATQQALVAAASQGHIEIVEYLLDLASVKPDEPDSLTGETALTLASCRGDVNLCSVLLNRNASIDAVNCKNKSPLMLAAREGHWAVVERLLQHLAPIEQTDDQGRTPLILAAGEGHVGILELLLEKGANVEHEDTDGMTALTWASMRGRMQAAQCLLDHGALINCADKTGRSPLDLAAAQGNPNLVQLLIDRGAMIEHVDVHGMRPLDRAVSCRNLPVVQCFLRKGAKLGPMTWQLSSGRPDILLVLLNKLLEDGNFLFRRGHLKDAAHRYNYALNKFPSVDKLDSTFKQLRVNFLLNYSRCKRKMNDPKEAVELASQVLKFRQDSFEAYYARAKAKIDLRLLDDAASDIEEALHLVPFSNKQVHHALRKLQDDIKVMSRQTSIGNFSQSETSL